MDFANVLMFSIVEGVSEFLPISSTGHLVLTSTILGIKQTEFVKSFEIFIQLGAIMAVVVLYWRLLIKRSAVWKRIIAGFIPTAVVGFVLYKLIKSLLLGNVWITVLALSIGGLALIILEIRYKEKEHHIGDLEHIPLTTAFLIGVCQSISVVPGVSRAAATIIGGLYLGVKRQTATEFSFLLAIPTMLAATVLDLKESSFAFSQNEIQQLVIGFIFSFIAALLAVKFLMKFIKTHTFIPFGIYRIIIALIFIMVII